jgi:outer membrane protein OmpA-like peptidoglycan-associated protein
MKQKLVFAFSSMLLLAGAAQAQDGGKKSSDKRSFIGFHINALDTKTPQVLKDNSAPRTLAGLLGQSYGFSISYWRQLTSHIDLSGKVTGMFHDYSSGDRNEATLKQEFGLEVEPTINIRAFKEESLLNAFLTGGVGAGMYTGKFGAYAPAGVGLMANFNSQSYIMLQAQYRFTLTKDVLKDNIFYSFGVGQRIGARKPKVLPPPPPPVVLDKDGDGINDTDDKCPDVAGLAALQGCPDRDGDGIADGEDKCPDVKGIAKYQGCPIPDTDGDGINDEQDKCPNEKGLARYQGCPIPDTDGDGVNDEEDKCINEKGPASNYGCPVIDEKIVERVNKAAQNVFFATGSSKLLAKSFPKLNDVVTILKENPSYKVQIDGHTDDVGKDENNQTLSENRAAAVKAYLVSKGIEESRLASAGYGETKPVADNKTAAGRAKNRRVEMSVRNY